jgi:hypothetical protein
MDKYIVLGLIPISGPHFVPAIIGKKYVQKEYQIKRIRTVSGET